MRSKRTLLGVLAAGLLGAPAGYGQYPMVMPAPATSGSGLVPPDLPSAASPVLQVAPPKSDGTGAVPKPEAPGLPPIPLVPVPPPPVAAVQYPSGPPPDGFTIEPGAGAMGTLSNPPGLQRPGNYLPLGDLTPWSKTGAQPGCCGPTGANGPVTYELYARTGPGFVIGGSPAFSASLKQGWVVSGGGRTLLMNQAGTAAWALDLGLSYQFTEGNRSRELTVFAPQGRNTNGQLNGPDQLQDFSLHNMARTSFNYAIGRDWWLNGPAYTGAESGWNARLGFDVGGRYGTARVNLVPIDDPTNYLRRHEIYHGVFVGMNWNYERPFGGCIWFIGGRVEWDYNWTNLIPPQDGNLQDLNVMFSTGIRF